MWLNLTPDDVAHWNERADALYAPNGKLLVDPYVQSPITSGTVFVAFDLSQANAEVIAGRLNHRGVQQP
jgi:hypothetical protein